METRKFIYYFFLLIVFGATTIMSSVNALNNGGFWNWVVFLLFAAITSRIVHKLEESFKSKE